MSNDCEHKYVLIGEPQRKYNDRSETVYAHRFFCEKCLDMRTKLRHVHNSGEYWTEEKERQ